MRILRTIVLSMLAVLAVTLAVVLAVNGNLARVTGWYRFEPGMPIFNDEHAARLDEVTWMRLADLHDTIECERDAHGVWWIIKPFRDRMSPAAAQRILDFTRQARLVETIPYNRSVRRNIRDYGVETAPITVTLKAPDGHDLTTIARYTLGSASPWLEDMGNGTDVIPTTYLRTDLYGRDRRIHVVTGNISALFKDGLESLRDPHPLHFDPEQLRDIRITRPDAEPLLLQRISSESPWVIAAPVLTAADDDKVNALARGLANLTALRTEDEEKPDAEAPGTLIELTMEDGSQQELRLGESTAESIDDQAVCRATVSDREVVFLLPADRKVTQRGSYGRLIQAVCELPVFPDRVMGQVRLSRSTVYTKDLPLTLPELRSLRFADIDTKDIARVALLSPSTSESLRLFLVPGNEENAVDDVWMYAPARAAFKPAENAAVTNLLKGLSDIPVEEVVADGVPGEDMSASLARYGLNNPTYLLMLQPNPCAVRMSLFGLDMPLVKDRAPRTLAISRATDPATGKRAWFGTELGLSSVSRLSTKLTRLLSLRPEKWKSRSLADFPLSAVRRLTLDYQQSPLVLDYDYIGESWTGTLGGADVTPRINPHRAEYYIRSLQKLKVQQWLDADDADAVAALQKPLFRVKLELEITDYSDAEAAVIEQAANDESNQGDAEQMLNEESKEGDKLRDIALAERPTHRETRTLEIAPAAYDSDKPFFYGRILETGEFFILSFDDAQSLAGDILDM